MADVSTLGLAVDSSGVRRATDDLKTFAGEGKRAEGASRELESAMTRAATKGQILGEAIGSAIVKVGQLASDFVKLGLAAGDYQDLAEKTGGSAEGLASMRTAADVANTSVSAAADASVRLAVSLSKVDDESKGASRALGYLGIDVKEFQALRPDEQFEVVAKALAKIPDGANKAAVAVALYGRAGADLLPFLKELGSQTERVTYLTAEQIARADEFADSAARNRSELTQLAQAMATETLPAISAFLGAAKETIAELVGITGASKTLGAESGVREFAFSSAEALGSVVDVGDGVVRVFKGIGLTIGGVGAAVAAAASGNFSQAKTILGELGDDLDALAQREQFGVKLARQIQEARDGGGGASYSNEGRGRERTIAGFKAQADHAKKVRDVYGDLIKRISEKTAVEQAELDSTEKLTAGQRMQAEIFDSIDSGRVKLSLSQKLNVDAALQELLATEKLNAAKEREIEWQKRANDENASAVEKQQGYRDQLEEKRKDAEADLREYGLTREELQKLEVVRLRDAAASLEQKAVQADNAYLSENARLYREQADQLDRTADARERLAGRERADRTDPMRGAQRAVTDYLREVENAGVTTERVVGDALRGLEDVTLDVLTGKGGKDAAKRWVDQIINEAMRLYVIKPLLASIFGGGGAGGWGSLFTSIAALFAGGSTTAPGDAGGINAGYPAYGLANGGPAKPGRTYLVGERGPELLRMGGDAGTVVPNEAIGGKGRSVTVNVINNAGNAKATTRERETDEGTVIDVILDAIAADIQSGGKTADALSGTYGLNRAGSAPRY